MLLLKKIYPFDPSLKHHIIIALGLAIWIFVFLYFTEPLSVNELGSQEKLIYLPFYGIAGALAYLMMMPFQYWLFRRNENEWHIQSELLFFLLFISFALVVTRSVYLYVIVPGEANPYDLSYFISNIYFPAILTIVPIVLAGRWAFGKYKNKKLEDQKIEIEGEGAYEGLRLLLTDLIVIKADDNYIEVSYLHNNLLKKQLIRNRLSTVTQAFPDLLQTHRSYLINPYHFRQWKTTNGKVTVLLQNEIEVPVSKTFLSTVKERIHSTTK
ncbi:MAG: LytTR family transcriptional regulator [Flavobacteriaceae bacterium]|nr:LytTR family transcriptional regulator [Flavobacteriaceae bacterium]